MSEEREKELHSVQLTVRLTEHEKFCLERIAEHDGLAISAVLRLALRQYIRNYQQRMQAGIDFPTM